METQSSRLDGLIKWKECSMAHPTDTQDKSTDRKAFGHKTEPMEAKDARQGYKGRPVLIILLAGILLAMLAWIPLEWWGNSLAPEQPGIQTAPGPASTNPVPSNP
ncbi:MAG: hypothetical protein ACOH2J_12310 [Allorhizobium sp.]